VLTNLPNCLAEGVTSEPASQYAKRAAEGLETRQQQSQQYHNQVNCQPASLPASTPEKFVPGCVGITATIIVDREQLEQVAAV
jgi:hypothetical protein